MNQRTMKKTTWTVVGLILIIVVAGSYYLEHRELSAYGASLINRNLDAGNIEFGMTRDNVEQLLGDDPQTHYGFAHTYTFKYEIPGLGIMYDQEETGKVRYIRFEDTRYSAFGVRVGDTFDEAVGKLKSLKYFSVEQFDSFARFKGRGIVVSVLSTFEKTIDYIEVELQEGRVPDDVMY